jgi:hypothetical protein
MASHFRTLARQDLGYLLDYPARKVIHPASSNRDLSSIDQMHDPTKEITLSNLE